MKNVKVEVQLPTGGKTELDVIKTKLKNRRLISLATDYSIHTLGMKEIFIKTASNDRNMIENLEAKGFESLGEENGNIIYLKETEDTLNNQRKLA